MNYKRNFFLFLVSFVFLLVLAVPGEVRADGQAWDWSHYCSAGCAVENLPNKQVDGLEPGSQFCVTSVPSAGDSKYSVYGYKLNTTYFGDRNPHCIAVPTTGSVTVTPSIMYNAIYGTWNSTENRDCCTGGFCSCGYTSNGGTYSGSVSYTPKIIPVAGVCSATACTCTSGSVSGCVDNGTYYSWSCNSTTGGGNVNCTANKPPIAGVCSNPSVRNTCAVGVADDAIIADTVSEYKWQCTGPYGGTSPTCSVSKPLRGACASVPPYINACDNGDVIASTTNQYAWKCSGTNGGAVSPQCSRPVPIRGVCNTTVENGCSVGNAVPNYPADTDLWYNWTCFGSYGSGDEINAYCSKRKPVDGVCSIPLVNNMCAAGDPYDVPDDDSVYKWVCLGLFGSIFSPVCSQAIPPAPSGLVGTCQASTGLVNLSWNDLGTSTHYIVKADKQDTPTNLWQDDCSLTDNPGDVCLEIENVVAGYPQGAVGMIPVPGDYNGDGIADLALWNPVDGMWYVKDVVTKTWIINAYDFGSSTSIPVPGDYNGDGISDLVLWDSATWTWIIRSGSGTHAKISANYVFGGPGMIPVPGDYDNDINNISDLALWNPTDGTWRIRTGTATVVNGITTHAVILAAYAFGSSTMIPVPGDYNGDGKADLVLWNPATGIWYGRNADVNHWLAIKPSGYAFGSSTMIPVPGDYNGDGKTDLALRDPADGTWYIIQSTTNTTKNWLLNGYAQGNSTWKPAPGDYNGDGVDDLAFWKPGGTSSWYIKSFFTDNSYSFTTSTTTLPVNYKWSVQAVTDGVLSHETLGTNFGCSNGVAGVCSSNLNQCTTGTATNISTTTEQQKWDCTSSGGVATTSCTQLIPTLSMPCDEDSITLSWATTTNATKYYIYKNGTDSDWLYATVNAPNTTYDITYNISAGDVFFVSSVISDFESGMTTGANIPYLSAPTDLQLALGEINEGLPLSPGQPFDLTISASAQNPYNQYLKMEFGESTDDIGWSPLSSFLLKDPYSTSPDLVMRQVNFNSSFIASDEAGQHDLWVYVFTYPVCNIINYPSATAIAGSPYTVSGVVCGPATGWSYVDFPGETACSEGSTFTENTFVGDNWNWKCKNANNLLSNTCIATKISALDPALTCSATMTPYVNPVMINTNTTWKATPDTCPNCKINWNIVDANGTTTSSVSTTTLNQTFTTIGEKQVVARVASSTDDVYGPPCSATTSVTRTGGTIIER